MLIQAAIQPGHISVHGLRSRWHWIEKTVSAFTLATSTDSSAWFKNCKDCWTKNKNNRLAGTLTLTLDTIFSSEFSIFAMCFGSISIEHMRWIKWLSRVCANHVWLIGKAHLCFDIASAYCILHLCKKYLLLPCWSSPSRYAAAAQYFCWISADSRSSSACKCPKKYL